MYNGYLLKINNVVFSNDYILDGSYQVSSKPIILNDYYDGNYDRHITYAPKKEVMITFSLARMLESNVITALTMLTSSEELTIEYYNNLTGNYERGKFVLTDNINPALLTIVNGYAVFKSQAVKLVRKKAIV